MNVSVVGCRFKVLCFNSEGAVIALELNGDGVVEACKNIASEVFSGTKVI